MILWKQLNRYNCPRELVRENQKKRKKKKKRRKKGLGIGKCEITKENGSKNNGKKE